MIMTGYRSLAFNTLQDFNFISQGTIHNWQSNTIVLRGFVLEYAPGVKFEKSTLMAVSVHNNSITQPVDCVIFLTVYNVYVVCI